MNKVIEFVVLILIAPTIFGCSFLTPGLDTRVAHEADNTMQWNADGSITTSQKTTHNERRLIIEGVEGGAQVIINQDGVPEVTGVANMYWQKTDPTDVAGSYYHLADKNAEVAANLTQMLQTVIPQVVPYLRKAPSTSGSNMDIAGALNQLQAASTQPAVQDAVQQIKNYLASKNISANSPVCEGSDCVWQQIIDILTKK